MHYIVSDDLHVLVSVGARVLVPESNYMTQFVHHYAELITILPDGDRLRTATTLPDKRAASVKHIFIKAHWYLQWRREYIYIENG